MPTDPQADPQSTIAAWRILLRFFGIIVVLAVFSHWYAAGQNTGWTKNRIAETQVDEITGIEYVTYKDHFMPGVELLSAGITFGLLLSAATFIRLKPKSKAQ
ncbi:MAG: hypothetical protein ABII82_03770 [Verrucomicrobiota bacterium]